MPSLIVTSHTAAVQVAAERLDKKYTLTALTIDNDGGGADRTIRLQDVFTPAVSDGTAAPTEQTVDRLRLDVLLGDVMVLNEKDLKGIEFLGALKVIGDAIDADCHITVGYKPI